MFNSALGDAGLAAKDVRLIRHKDNRASKGRSPYELWRDERPSFDLYQSNQPVKNRGRMKAQYWAVFIADTNNETMFGGLYRVKYIGVLQHDTPKPHIAGGVDKAGSCDIYDLTLDVALEDLIGRLFIDWGPGALAWVQRAERNDKPITEIRPIFREDAFPGFLNFVRPLSMIEKLPKSWEAALTSSRGIYLLTCPKTKEQYVGSATGGMGFLGRWRDYVASGHGGNLGLKSRSPSDYQISILEVAGSAATTDDIFVMEGRWQSKLQSKQMGLNRNWASAK